MSDSEDEPMMPHGEDEGSSPSSCASPSPLISPPSLAPSQPVNHSFLGVLSHTLLHFRSNPSFQHSAGPARIAVCAVFLGGVLGVGSQWILLAHRSILLQLGLYLVAMSSFHLIEFTWTAIFHPSKLSSASFLLNHSREYHIALAAGLVEFALEAWLFPSWKYPHSSLLMLLGVFVVLAGQATRTLAMLTAASNFTHIVAESRLPSHELVTHGIYNVCRHPSYAGWFFWSVGTQILLANPVCIVAYSVASFMFFKGRINHEERAMINFFGDSYVQYQKRVPSGVPGIRGYMQ